MPEFFTDNPILVIIIIFVIVRLLRGNKGKKGEEAPADRRKSVSGRNAARHGRFDDLKATLEDAVREADRQFSTTTGFPTEPAPKAAVTEVAAPAEVPAGGSASPRSPDPYAFHSMMNRQEERSTDLSRIDYDATAVDYDTVGDAFAFRSATSKPQEQGYHLTGFTGFRSAGGISRDPVTVRAVGEPAAPPSDAAALLSAIDDPAALRQAIVVREILDKPLALRRR